MADQAVKDIKKEIYLLIHKTGEMLELTEDAFMKNKIAPLEEAESILREIRAKEDALTAKLAAAAGSSGDARAILLVPVHVEKIADSIERIMGNIRVKIKEGLLFSDKAIQETGSLLAKGKDLLKKAGEVVVTGSAAGFNAVRTEGDVVIKMAEQFATAHENRLVEGQCSPKASSNYLCILYAFEDMVSHAKNAVNKFSA